MKREFPDIKTDRTQGYASFLVSNWDTIQECFNLEVTKELEQKLQALKEKAQERLEDQGMMILFGGERMQIMPQGTKGKSWVLKNDDFMIMIGRGNKEWKVSVRYLSGGLWEYGLYDLKARIMACLLREMRPNGKDVEIEKLETWQRLSRADYAFDFYSPEFSKEMTRGRIRECLVLPSGVKGGLVFDSNRDETLTIGFNRTGLQVQVYDKGKEITDISGKDWFYKIYEREGYFPDEAEKGKHIWRVEFRFCKDFIKDRGLLTLEDVTENLQPLLLEAIAKRRLATIGDDINKARWALHPLWAEIYHLIDYIGAYRPMGRLSTMKAEAKAEMLKTNIAGTLRSLQVLEKGDYDHWAAYQDAQDCALRASDDKDHLKKLDKAKEKYAFEKEAK